MYFRCALAVVVLSAGISAQSAAPSCPADRLVDEIIAEVHAQQSKKKNRNTNPFPNVACIWGWCRDRSQTPPDSVPRAQTPGAETASPPETTSSNAASSSRSAADSCDAATIRALEAAHHVEIGDYYFEERNYRAALMRFRDALNQKPGDAAIHVRLGRVLEKTKDPRRALEHYQAAEKLAPPEPWSREARTAIARLQATAKP